MKYWLIWLFGFLAGMSALNVLQVRESPLLEYGGDFTDIGGGILILLSIVFNAFHFANALFNAWEVKLE